jgi:hypothetical protein
MKLVQVVLDFKTSRLQDLKALTKASASEARQFFCDSDNISKFAAVL